MFHKIFLSGFLGMSVAFLLATTAYACSDPAMQDCHGNCIPEDHLCILEPWPGMPISMPPAAASTPLGPFFYYINSGVWQWAFRMAVAVAILNGVYGGFTIARSNGDSGKVDEGKQRFLWSALGLLILLLAGVILTFINPLGFSETLP